MSVMRTWVRSMAVAFAIVAILVAALLVFITQPVFSAASAKAPLLAKPDRLKTDVAFLTEDPHRRSYPRVSELDRAANYVHQQFVTTGARVSEQTYIVDEQTYRNVIASFGPEGGERIVVGAHYDSYGGLPGADDNASGTAAILELARLLTKESLKTRVDLMAYTLEEPPFFRTAGMGSMHHAKSLRDAKVKLKGMICLEMVGYFTDAPDSQQYPVGVLKSMYPSRGDFIAVVGSTSDVGLVRKVKAAMIQANDLPVSSINAPGALTGVDFSDHLSYWQHGYSAVMISDTSFFRNDYYHTPRDTAETLDYPRMARVVDKVRNAVIALAKE
jgi:Zn-dependent M28 family amino/carboxypeptidase